ncbi:MULTISPECIES: NAD(P)H-binding protein [Nocardioides]|uniref:NAD(P)H-binding protein n=1 Tax=Nocardioides vastitatis TaxID=2568655 RepID=A0ABW0ZKB8_9ACTN|nr:NAD(P)H-binding protein [Nocardioides sp.]
MTGATDDVGGVSRTIVEMLRSQGHPVRAFVRRDDDRAHALRQAGAHVFVGDLLDVAAAVTGCRRVYFSISLSSYYTDAVSLMAAAARDHSDLEVFVSISDYERSYMTFERMTAPAEERRAWLGGLVSDWSPQQRAHWIAEQVLSWSDLPVVNVRATIFAENPILTGLALRPLSSGELRLPFGSQRLAPIAGRDVAELCASILVDPAPHLGASYELTGPDLKDMHGFAEDFGAVLGREVTYIAEERGGLERDLRRRGPVRAAPCGRTPEDPDQAGRRRAVRRGHQPAGDPARPRTHARAVGPADQSAPPGAHGCSDRLSCSSAARCRAAERAWA